MNNKLFKTAAVMLGAGAMLASCGNVRQPSAGCIVLDATNWIFKYDLVEGQNIPTECQAALNLPGELVGVYKFLDPQTPNSTVLALRPNGLVTLSGGDPGDPKEQTAVGSMTETPDAEDFCTAATFSEAKVSVPATNISYTFSNMQVYSAANAPGTQIRGELQYTRNGCTARFKVRGMWPAVGCDASLDPKTDPAGACDEGSGINPDFAVKCEATLPNLFVRERNADGSVKSRWPGTCVPDGAIPALKPAE